MPGVDVLVEQHGPAGGLARLAPAILDPHQIARLHVLPVDVVGSDDEGAPIDALREGPLGAGEELLVAGAPDELAHLAPHLPLPTAVPARRELVHADVMVVIAEQHVPLAEADGRADPPGGDLQPRAVVESLEGLERPGQIGPAHHHAVVFQHHGPTPPGEDPGDLLAQVGAAGQAISSHPDLTADQPHVGDEQSVWDLADDGKSDQRRRVGMDHGVDVRPSLVDPLVERELHRRRVGPGHPTVRTHVHDVVAGQRPLVRAARSDPDVAVLLADGEVPARSRRHAIAIDTIHGHDDLTRGVE